MVQRPNTVSGGVPTMSDITDTTDLSQYPVRLTLAFRSEAARESWTGGLLDGWGEGGPFDVHLDTIDQDGGPWAMAVYDPDKFYDDEIVIEEIE